MTKIISVFKLSFAENPEMIKLFRKIKSTGTSYLWARHDYFSVQFLVLSFFKFRTLYDLFYWSFIAYRLENMLQFLLVKLLTQKVLWHIWNSPNLQIQYKIYLKNEHMQLILLCAWFFNVTPSFFTSKNNSENLNYLMRRYCERYSYVLK